MSLLRQLTALAVIVAMTAASAVFAFAAGKPLAVTSSLDGKKVLPQQVRWLAHPNVSPAEVAEVNYFVDGRLRWTEHGAPYNYGGDDHAGHLGYFFTSWLAPGKHRFTIRVRKTDGHTATDEVAARVVSAPAPPTPLSGAWTRTLTAEDRAKSDPKYGADNKPPTGKWKLIIDRTGIWELDPLGTGIVGAYAVNGNVLQAKAPIQMVPSGKNGPGHIKRFGAQIDAGGGVDCNEAGPFGTYHWSVAGDQLNLRATHEACGQRRAVYEGTWTRIS